MSLIICPECKRNFSDKAPACPNCGYPANLVGTNEKNTDSNILGNNLNNKKIMANNIKYYLKLYNKTPSDICKLLGFPFATFSDWINAKSYPRIDKIELMANYFGISKSDLIESNVTTQEDIHKMIFTENLNSYIKASGKSQLEIAKKIGVSPQTFNTWCRGIAIPRMEKLQALADYFHINKSDLIELKSNDNKYYESDETREIAQEIFEKPELRSLFDVAKDIPPERLKAHIEFMKSLKDSEK